MFLINDKNHRNQEYKLIVKKIKDTFSELLEKNKLSFASEKVLK
jgi:hypothetical protein